MESAVANYEHFAHVRIIIGMVLGISVVRLVMGLSEFLQHPDRKKIYWIHMCWALYLFLMIIHFWWYEFGLSKIRVWSFGVYLFLICYSCLFVFVASLLFPSNMAEYENHEDYFQSRRKTFYSMIAVLAAVDFIDTALKGFDHVQALGIEYQVQQASLVLLAAIAIFVQNKVYQGAFVVGLLVYKSVWIYRLYWVLG